MSTKTVKRVKTPTEKKSKKVNEYRLQVLNPNAQLKAEFKTLGGCLKQMWFFRDEMNLTKGQIDTVRLLRKDDAAYKVFSQNCRTSKKGNYSPFFVLQAIYKAKKESAKK